MILNCKVVDQNRKKVIIITGITKGVPSGAHRLKLKNIVNPFSDSKTPNFVFETLEPGTNTVVEYFLIEGI